MLGLNRRIYERIKNMLVWGGMLLGISFGFSIIFFELEQLSGRTIVNDLSELYWWWISTVTGLGSSVTPTTPESAVVATIVVILGFLLLGLVISEISAIIRMIYSRKEEGNIKVRARQHIVVFGYTSLTAGVLKLLKRTFGKDLKVVLISNDIEFNPFPGQVDFIHDNPVDHSTLVDASVFQATAAIILANDRFRDPDVYSVVIASGIEQMNSKVVTIVEIVDESNKDLFKLTNIDGFINRKELISDLLQNNPNPKLLRIIEKESQLVSKETETPGKDLL